MNAESVNSNRDLLQVDSDELVDAIYGLALNPDQFDSFSLVWDEFIRSSSDGNESHEEINGRLNELLGHHFERAFKLMERIGREGHLETSTSDYVASRLAPSIELDSSGGLLTANHAASEYFLIPPAAPTLLELFSNVLHEGSIKAVIHSFEKVCNGQKMVAVLVLLSDRTPCVFVVKRLKGSSSIIIDVAATRWSDSAESILNSNYALTVHECEIVSLLYQGLSAKRIAQYRDRSEETVRTQIRSVLKKMHCESQAQLVRLLTGLVFLSGEQEHSGWLSNRYSINRVSVKNNRSIEFYDVGNPCGKALVIFHGIMHTPELPECLLDSLLNNGYRVIGVCRAGYGHSSPPSSWRGLLESNADDVSSVLSHLSISRVSCIGILGGSAFAYAFAARFTGIADQVIAISGVVPYMSKRDVEQLPPVARAMAVASASFPKLLPLLVRSAVAVVDRGDTQKIAQMAYRDSPVDLTVALTPTVLPKLKQAYRFTASQGYSAYAYNGVAVTADHRLFVNELTCPIALIHGVEDQIQSIESVRRFAENYDNVTLSEVDNVGQLAIFSEPEEITTLVMRAFERSAFKAAS